MSSVSVLGSFPVVTSLHFVFKSIALRINASLFFFKLKSLCARFVEPLRDSLALSKGKKKKKEFEDFLHSFEQAFDGSDLNSSVMFKLRIVWCRIVYTILNICVC